VSSLGRASVVVGLVAVASASLALIKWQRDTLFSCAILSRIAIKDRGRCTRTGRAGCCSFMWAMVGTPLELGATIFISAPFPNGGCAFIT
jgi:hypothetical protein